MSRLHGLRKLKVAFTPTTTKLLPWLCVGLFLAPLLIQKSSIFRAESHQGLEQGAGSKLDSDEARLTEPVRELVEAIRRSTRQALGDGPDPYTDQRREAWEKKYPCRAREELKPLYSQRKHMADVPENGQWDVVFREYGKLHRACTSRIGDLERYLTADNKSIPACKFVIAETHFGLGNKLYHLSSVFMYAVLSQRVILVPELTSVPFVVCEPFPGSSWKLSPRVHEMVKKRRKPSLTFFDDVDLDLNKTKSFRTYASAMSNVWGPEPRFWCNTEQSYLSKVTWLTIDGCLLFLHKLWAVDMFRPALEAMFPNRIAFTYILRSLMLPTNQLWDRILHVNEVYLGNADKQVGLQVRFLSGEGEYKSKNELINGRVARCLWDNNILPEVCPSKKNPSLLKDPKFANCSEKVTLEDHRHPKVIKVLIASLFLGVHDHLSDIYLRHEATTTREVVGITQLTHEAIQNNGLEVDSQAFVEIIALSLSDVLIVTPQSTFGGVAQAYGGLIPWFIEYAKPKGEPDKCERGLGIEPCFLGANPHYDCPHDPPGYQDIPDLLPYFRNCLFIDVGNGYGMQMVPDRREDHDFSRLD